MAKSRITKPQQQCWVKLIWKFGLFSNGQLCALLSSTKQFMIQRKSDSVTCNENIRFHSFFHWTSVKSAFINSAIISFVCYQISIFSQFFYYFFLIVFQLLKNYNVTAFKNSIFCHLQLAEILCLILVGAVPSHTQPIIIFVTSHQAQNNT